MRIASISENQNLEKRIAITPEIAKKYISLGFEVSLLEGYGNHLGIKDEEYKKLGTHISKDEKEILNSANIIVQLGLPTDEKNSIIKENQTLIGILNPYNNEEKLKALVKKNINDVKIVINGAGASAMACANLFINTGVKDKNITMLDSKGVIHSERDNLNEWKKKFAIKTKNRT